MKKRVDTTGVAQSHSAPFNEHVATAAKSLKVAIYVRVSTDDQSNDMQITELREYAARQGWKIVAEYSDVESGSKADRKGLQDCLESARRGQFDVVLCWKLDRFGRSVPDFLRNIHVLDTAKVRWIATTQGLDTGDDSAMGRFFLQIMAAIAELERNMIRERTRAGLREAKRKGKRLGRKPLSPAVVSQVMALRAKGETIRAIHGATGVSVGAVSAICAESATE